MKNRLFVKNTKSIIAIICIITLLIIGLFLGVVFGFRKQEKEKICFRNITDSNVVIYPFIIDDNYYVFIPSGFVIDDFSIESDSSDAKYSINDNVIHISAGDEKYDIEIVQTDSIPTMFIDVKIGDIKSVDSDVDKNSKVRANFRIYDEDADKTDEQMGSLKGRGNTSWLYYQKKPYNINFDEAIDILGMSKSRKWCIVSCSTDKYLIGNALVYGFSRQMDFSFTPDCRFVNVYIDGNYNGLYLLSEKIEVEENRLNLDKSKSYLLESDINMQIDKLNNYFITDDNTIIEIGYPEVLGQSYKDNISKQVQELEDALKDYDSDKWKNMIDIDSWARLYLIDELFENADGGYDSVYFYRNEDGVFVRGPVWDYDRILGYGSDLIMANNKIKKPNQINTNYYYYLLQREQFRNRVLEILKDEIIPLVDGYTENMIESFVKLTESSAKANAIRWNRELETNYGQQIYEFLKKRSAFLVDYYSDVNRYCKVQIEDDYGYLNNYVVLKGQKISDIKDLDHGLIDRNLYHKDSNEIFDPDEVIEQDICLVRNTSYDSYIPNIVINNGISIGVINTLFIVLFVFCFVVIAYIMNKRFKDE